MFSMSSNTTGLILTLLCDGVSEKSGMVACKRKGVQLCTPRAVRGILDISVYTALLTRNNSLSAAFYTVSHTILLERMKYDAVPSPVRNLLATLCLAVGISDKIFDWLSS